MTDIVDVKGGVGVGLGAKVEVTNYVGTAVGLGMFPFFVETFGRRFDTYHYGFVQLGIIGGDGDYYRGANHTTEHERNFVLFQWPIERPPWVQRFRVGGEVLGLVGDLGIYLNFGEFYDLVVGFFGADPAHDDQLPIPKATYLHAVIPSPDVPDVPCPSGKRCFEGEPLLQAIH